MKTIRFYVRTIILATGLFCAFTVVPGCDRIKEKTEKAVEESKKRITDDGQKLMKKLQTPTTRQYERVDSIVNQ